jgi:FkbM family methyltransferase
MTFRAPTVCALLVLVGSLGFPRSDEQHRDIVGTEHSLYSQGNEEVIIRDFFQDRRDGMFLDVGCAWPIKNNNTYYLEERLGWYGIAIDALPEYARPWRKRRNSKFFNYIVTDHGGSIETFFRSALLGVSAFRPPIAPDGSLTSYEEVKVPTTTLTQLLDRNHVRHVDLVSMDIEGAEPLALAGFDIDRFKPTLLCVEVHTEVRGQVADYFQAHGYQQLDRYLSYDRTNYYFTPVARLAASST